MALNEKTERQLQRALITLEKSSPFFAVVARFARTLERTTIPTAATDGKDLFLNPDYFASLKPRERAGLLLHEVLHAALLHVPRRGPRDPMLWNIAADIVVNGMIVHQGELQLPPGGVREVRLEHLSVEEVYYQLLKNPEYGDLVKQFSSQVGDLVEVSLGGALDDARREELRAHWRDALNQAEAVTRGTHPGTAPLGLERELGVIKEAQIDWRTQLWRFLVQTPTDFQGFDRRQIGQGYYLEALEGETVYVAVAVDTSGSIRHREITAFTSEIQGILGSYPHIRCDLYYADAGLYGPYPLHADGRIPPPIGGGGTDFRPFFDEVTRWNREALPTACVYLTDGYGEYPAPPPNINTLWVILGNGISLDELPFGDGIRLLLD